MSVLTVKINGVEYNLKGDEKEEYLRKIAGYVDRKMKETLNNNSKLSVTSAAVLTAVNAVDDLFKCNHAYSELIVRCEELEKSGKLYIEEIERLKTEIQQLKDDNDVLSEKCRNDQSKEQIREKDEKISCLNNEIDIIKESAQKYINENTTIKNEMKDVKFQLQSSKYKIMDLQNKLVQSQMDLAKLKRFNNPLIK